VNVFPVRSRVYPINQHAGIFYKRCTTYRYRRHCDRVLFDEEMKSTKTTRSTTGPTATNNNTSAAVVTTSSSSRPNMSEIEEPVEIKHSYTIGNLRSVYVDGDNDVSIVDDRDNGKRAFFTAQ